MSQPLREDQGSSPKKPNPAQLIAFYLPQFHPIPENDTWWGTGFTEWRNVVRARPRFAGHEQPHLPADLGFYDLRIPEVRQAQADLARRYGISAFCYYHYWFHGRRLLHRPFDEVLASGEPDFPFCLCWPNENWTSSWDGGDRSILISQDYSSEDDLNHIRWLAEAFSDPRYLRVEGKPLFLVYRASRLPDARRMVETWREECQRLGVGDIYLCQVHSVREVRDPRTLGFDGAVEFQPFYKDRTDLRRLHAWRRRLSRLIRAQRRPHRVYDYASLVADSIDRARPDYPLFRCAVTSWDNSPRREKSLIFHGSTPEKYEEFLRECIRWSLESPAAEPLVFVNAWNEWAEGAHLEPCERWGHGYLEATARALESAGRAPIRSRSSLYLT